MGAGGGEWTAEHLPRLCHAALSVCRQGCHRSRWVWICLGWVCCLACTFNIVVILSPCQYLLGLKIGFLSHVFVLPFQSVVFVLLLESLVFALLLESLVFVFRLGLRDPGVDGWWSVFGDVED